MRSPALYCLAKCVSKLILQHFPFILVSRVSSPQMQELVRSFLGLGDKDEKSDGDDGDDDDEAKGEEKDAEPGAQPGTVKNAFANPFVRTRACFTPT